MHDFDQYAVNDHVLMRVAKGLCDYHYIRCCSDRQAVKEITGLHQIEAVLGIGFKARIVLYFFDAPLVL